MSPLSLSDYCIIADDYIILISLTHYYFPLLMNIFPRQRLFFHANYYFSHANDYFPTPMTIISLLMSTTGVNQEGRKRRGIHGRHRETAGGPQNCQQPAAGRLSSRNYGASQGENGKPDGRVDGN